eukprot:GHVS01063419.1.p1 GENE.GHVS01063419.1~~GHVS01063419.1.p1  ORF type:complete len:344 (+),score=25.85 GHVS01063419.1:80-1033(+)
MKLTLKKRSGKFMDTLDVEENATVEDFKNTFYDKFHYYPERQRWTVGAASGEALKDGSLRDDFGVVEGTCLYFKDLGVQISWRLVFVVEYFGPLFIFPLVYFLPGWVYTWTHYQTGEQRDEHNQWLEADIHKPKGLTQTVALCLVLIHYLKRELETLFVHRFSNATMPIVRVPLNCGHYWVLFGVCVSYFLFHPQYTSPWDEETQKPIIYALAALMLIFEGSNFKTHLILRNLRQRGTKERGVPMGWGFGMVSCANYTWETLAWIVFCILTNTATGYLFCLVAFLQMTEWALKKHHSYKRDFKSYPRNRKAIIPWCL